jgi:hypothetical protein
VAILSHTVQYKTWVTACNGRLTKLKRIPSWMRQTLGCVIRRAVVTLTMAVFLPLRGRRLPLALGRLPRATRTVCWFALVGRGAFNLEPTSRTRSRMGRAELLREPRRRATDQVAGMAGRALDRHVVGHVRP